MSYSARESTASRAMRFTPRKLSFDHVRSGERLEFRAPLADDMVSLVKCSKATRWPVNRSGRNLRGQLGLTRFGV